MYRDPYSDYEGSRRELLKMLVEPGEEPAFLRRARTVDDAWQQLLATCRSQRDEMLKGPQLHLSILAEHVRNDWSQVADYLADAEQFRYFESLYVGWRPHLNFKRGRTIWRRNCRRLVAAFIESADRFDRAWKKSLQQLDLTAMNCLRREFNEYYPVEKACAFDCEQVDRLGFNELSPVTFEMLLEMFPPLEAPRLRSHRHASRWTLPIRIHKR